MSDDQSTPSPDQQQTPPEGEPHTPAPKTFDENYVKTLRSESAGYRTKAKEAETRAEEAERKATEAAEALTRVQTESGEATGRVAVAEARALKYEVALEKGLPLPLARRLDGSTREEIEADAESLLAFARQSGGAFLPEQGRTDAPPTAPGINDALRAVARG